MLFRIDLHCLSWRDDQGRVRRSDTDSALTLTASDPDSGISAAQLTIHYRVVSGCTGETLRSGDINQTFPSSVSSLPIKVDLNNQLGTCFTWEFGADGKPHKVVNDNTASGTVTAASATNGDGLVATTK